MKPKSDTFDIFKKFKVFVETYFKTKIRTLYSDNVGEYIKLTSFLSTNGISHFLTPPHTPQHNCFAECRHRHIVETGLALLHHASMPPPPKSTDFLYPSTEHPMQARSKRRRLQLNLTTKHPLPLDVVPSCFSQAITVPKWREAMSVEFNALVKDDTWDLVEVSPGQNVRGCKWTY